MKINKHIRIGFIVLSVILLISIGILVSWTIYNKNIEKNNHKAIRAVVNQIFTCPNQELITLYDEMYDNMEKALEQIHQGSDNTDNQLITYDGSKIEDKLREIYRPYFTENGYKNFEKRFLIAYNIYSTSIGYQVIVNKIDINQSKSIPTNYSFTAKLSHGKEGEVLTDIEVEGSVQIYEEKGKLSYIQFNDGGLYKVLLSSRY